MLKTVTLLLSYIRKQVKLLVFALVFSAISVLASLYMPILIGGAVDSCAGKGIVDFGALAGFTVVFAATFLISASAQWALSLCTNTLAYGTAQKLRADVFSKLHTLPLSYIDSHKHGDIVSRVIVDVEKITDGLLQGFTQLFSGILTILGTIVFMCLLNWRIAVLVVFLTPLSLFVAYFIAKNCHRMYAAQNKVNGQLQGYADEVFSGLKTVKVFSEEEEAEHKFGKINSELYEYGFKAQFFSALTNPSTRFINSIVYASIGITGALSVLSGGMSVGNLSSFLFYATQYTKPFNEISVVFAEFQNAVSAAERVFELLSIKEECDDGETVKTDFSGDIEAEHLCFSYDKSRKLIEDFNIYVKKGQHIAIVGPTGCGKTTLINLLMRFYDPDGGRITADGIDIRDMKRRTLRSMYGMVLQDTWLFHGTVKENIAYGAKSEATEDDIKKAAETAFCGGFIERLPEGYDTVIGDGGCSLSEGQKQLLCIARVMINVPPVLILDEATSNIDTRTELYIQKAFGEMTSGRTSFIVAHRLSTVRNADMIIVMKDGRIIEQGTHGELLEKRGFYSTMYNSR